MQFLKTIIEPIDPDTYVNWLRSEDPGQHPRWESKCGVIIQYATATTEYWGFIWPDENKIFDPATKGIYFTTFSAAKRKLERAYFALHPAELAAAY